VQKRNDNQQKCFGDNATGLTTSSDDQLLEDSGRQSNGLDRLGTTVTTAVTDLNRCSSSSDAVAMTTCKPTTSTR